MTQVLEENAMFKTPLPEQLSPTWKLMLLSDGSVTRHLQLLTGQHIKVVSPSPKPSVAWRALLQLKELHESGDVDAFLLCMHVVALRGHCGCIGLP